jgi:ribose/xylose/arabinose/galactoside ABC-type transport system permease subunit
MTDQMISTRPPRRSWWQPRDGFRRCVLIGSVLGVVVVMAGAAALAGLAELLTDPTRQAAFLGLLAIGMAVALTVGAVHLLRWVHRELHGRFVR